MPQKCTHVASLSSSWGARAAFATVGSTCCEAQPAGKARALCPSLLGLHLWSALGTFESQTFHCRNPGVCHHLFACSRLL